MISKEFIKENIEKIGSILALVGLFFLCRKLYENWQLIDFSRIDNHFFFLYLAGVAVGVFANFFQAFSWQVIVGSLSGSKSCIGLVLLYAYTQIAKYIPGNIFHFLGRQIASEKFNIKNTIIAKSTFIEIVFLAINGCLLSILAAPIYFHFLSPIYYLFAWLAIATIYLIFIKLRFNSHLFSSSVLQLLYLFLNAFVYFSFFIFLDETPLTLLNFFFIIGAFVLSWLVGYVTPGAPGGLGVREAVLLLIFSNTIQQNDLLLVVVFGRLSNITSDVVIFLISCLFQKKYHENK